MKKPVSKADESARLQREMEGFLNGGGEVESVPTGVSGKDPGDPPMFLNRRLFVEPPLPRTPIPEVVAAIEARRRVKGACRRFTEAKNSALRPGGALRQRTVH